MTLVLCRGRSVSSIRIQAARQAARRYNAASSRFGRYAVLEPSMATTAYPDPRPVPASIPRPNYVPKNFFTAPWGEHDSPEVDESAKLARGIKLSGGDEARLRTTARMVSEMLSKVGEHVKPGVTTAELDQIVHEMAVRLDAYPSTLGYSSYPRSCTTSVNNIIAHGIPDDRPLDAEDIINIDLTIFYDGYHGDTSATFLLPEVDRLGRNLVDATKEALELGIRACGPGKRLCAIGKTIDEFARRHKYSVNSQFVGHGIGRNFHQSPEILHFENNEEGVMMPGDCFTIEPCLVQGSNSRGFMWDDGWTMATESGARSAQFEHQVLITHDGVEVLTRRKGEET